MIQVLIFSETGLEIHIRVKYFKNVTRFFFFFSIYLVISLSYRHCFDLYKYREQNCSKSSSLCCISKRHARLLTTHSSHAGYFCACPDQTKIPLATPFSSTFTLVANFLSSMGCKQCVHGSVFSSFTCSVLYWLFCG